MPVAVDLIDLPYVLCPDIEGHGIRVIPLWFRPKGGGQECPVIILESVPVGFNTVLDAKGFLQRPEGWLIDVRDKDESFWKPIFGDISFLQRKPVKVYEPNKIVFAPPPGTVKVVIRNFTDEHISYLTKTDQVIGLEAVRASRNDALRGAVTCRGAWSIIKAAVLDRLTRNPEDVSTFEYVWSTAKAQSLDTTAIPTEIPHDSLLRKIVERQRLTAQMEQVVSHWFIKDGPAPFVYHVKWQLRKLFMGSANGGPVETRDFNEVEGVAQFLLDAQCKPTDDPQIIHPFSDRLIQVNEEAASDWVSSLDIPDIESPANNDSTVPQEPTKPTVVDLKSQSLNTLTWSDIYSRLDILFSLSERRIDYSRVICRYIFEQIINQEKLSLNHPGRLDNLEQLISLFAKVTNLSSLSKLWEREIHRIRELVNSLTVPGAAKFNLLKIFTNLSSLDAFAEQRLLECDGERLGWWWSGYACSKTTSSNEWQIFKVNSKSSNPIGTGLYPSPRQADEFLYRSVQAKRITQFKVHPKSEQWFVGYKTTTGPILQLSEIGIGTQVEAQENILQGLLTTFKYPKLWKAGNEPLSSERAISLLCFMVETIGLESDLVDFQGLLTFQLREDSTLSALWGGISFGSVYPGNILLIWSEAFTKYCQLKEVEKDRLAIIELIKGSEGKSDLDISLEDDLLDTLDSLSGEIVARLGSVAESILKEAIIHPTVDSERQCEGFWYVLKGEKASSELRAFLRSVILFAAQKRPFVHLSLAYRDLMRLNLPASTLFEFAMVRFLAIRMLWAGKQNYELTAIHRPGDFCAGELFPDASVEWQVFQRIDHLLLSVSKMSKANPHSTIPGLDNFGTKSVNHQR